jgi:hypothetical protein
MVEYYTIYVLYIEEHMLPNPLIRIQYHKLPYYHPPPPPPDSGPW